MHSPEPLAVVTAIEALVCCLQLTGAVLATHLGWSSRHRVFWVMLSLACVLQAGGTLLRVVNSYPVIWAALLSGGVAVAALVLMVIGIVGICTPRKDELWHGQWQHLKQQLDEIDSRRQTL